MTSSENKTDYKELWKFHCILMKSAPKGYYPYYFPLNEGDKDPIPNVSWKKNRKTIQEAMYLMRKKGNNIGIAGTTDDQLCIIDVDDLKQVPDIKPTLQVTSRKRIGRHNYYFAMDGTAKRNIPCDKAGEIRSIWQYVVAPGSYVPCSDEEISRMPEEERENAGRYSLNNELHASTITFDEIPEVYKKEQLEIKKREIEGVTRELKSKKKTYIKPKGCKESALWKLDITDVSGVSDTRGKKISMPSEVHGSETGHNCKVEDGLMHCYRHQLCLNSFAYLCIMAGIASCEQAGRPYGGKYFGVDSKDGETVFKVWLYAKEHGLIPIDDPIPRSALIYYAISRGCCTKDEIEEDYRLPMLGYTLTLLMGKQEGINFGRN